MSSANVVGSANRLKHHLRALLDRWETTKETWNDQVRRDFEAQHLAPLETAVASAINGMREFSEELAKLKADLSDRDEGS